MPYAVHPAMDGDQRSLAQPISDLGDSDAVRKQFHSCDHPVRFGRKLCELPIRRPALWSHCNLKAGTVRGSPPGIDSLVR